MEINFNDKDALQSTFNELTASCKLALEEAKNQKDLNLELAKQIKDLTESNMNFNDALTNIHIMLNSKKDLWRQDQEMQEFMNKFATWIASAGSIKLKVLRGNNESNS